jgi:glycosyltransferase involved in cell wall biosynthesis
MKIIHTAISTISARNFVSPLVEADLMSLKAHSELWATNDQLSYDIENTAHCIKIKKHECNLSANLLQNFFRLISTIIAFRKSNPDILIAHFSRGAFLPLMAGWLLNIKHRIYFNHGLPYLGHKGIIRFFLRKLDYFNCFFAHEIITVNKALVKFINSEITTNKKIHTLGAGSCCGISEDYFCEQTEDQKNLYKKELGINQESVVIIYVGRPVERKGYLVAYDAFCKLKEIAQRHDVTLLMAGISREDIFSSRQSIIEGVIPLGFRHDMKQLYGIADAVFLPSFHEGLPYCLFEGGAQKCALIASKLPGLDEIIIDHKTGRFINPNCIETTAQVLYDLIADPVQIKRMGDNCFEKIQMFKANIILDEYKKLMVKILDRNTQ